MTGGTFTLKFNAQTTAAIAFNADAAAVAATLRQDPKREPLAGPLEALRVAMRQILEQRRRQS